MQKSEHKDGFRVAYSWKGKKLYTSLYEKSFLWHQHGENATKGNLVRLYVIPEVRSNTLLAVPYCQV